MGQTDWGSSPSLWHHPRALHTSTNPPSFHKTPRKRFYGSQAQPRVALKPRRGRSGLRRTCKARLNLSPMAVGFNGIALHLMLSVQLKSLAEAETYGMLKPRENLTTEFLKGGSSNDTHLAELKAASPLHRKLKKKKKTLKTLRAAQADLKEAERRPGNAEPCRAHRSIAHKA